MKQFRVEWFGNVKVYVPVKENEPQPGDVSFTFYTPRIVWQGQ